MENESLPIHQAIQALRFEEDIRVSLEQIFAKTTNPYRLDYNKKVKLLPGEAEGLWQYVKMLERRYQDAELSRSRKTYRRTPFAARSSGR